MNKFKPFGGRKLFQGRPLTVVYKHIMDADWFRKFTFRERLKILLGFNVMVLIRVPTQHNFGKFIPVIALETTKHMKASDKIKEQLTEFMRRKYPLAELTPQPSDETVATAET